MKTRLVRIDRDSDSGTVYSYLVPRGEGPLDHRVEILIPSPRLERFLEEAALEYAKSMT